MMKSCAVQLHPAQAENHPFVQCIPPVTHSVTIWVTRTTVSSRSVCIQAAIILLNNDPKAQE